MKKLFVSLFLAAASAAHALSVFNPGPGLAGVEISVGPFTDQEPVLVAVGGKLTLETPGTYTAPSWSISGELHFGAPGNYIVVASNGAIAINAGAKVSGAPLATSSDPARVTFVPAAGYLFAGTSEGRVTISQGLPGIASESPPLVNISTRSTLVAGQTITSGFVVGGKVARRMLIRAIGPTLSTFGIANALATPVLTVINSQSNRVWRNDNWSPDVSLPGIFTSVGAFPLSPTSRDAAILLTLEPGSYTVQVNGGAGEVLTEIYYVE